MLHEGRKRADRIAQGLGARTLLPACSMRAASEPTESLGARRPDSPSGVLHEGRKRADRIARGLGVWNLKKVRPTRATSEPTVRSGAWHQGTTAGYEPIYGNISSNLVKLQG